MRWPVGCNFVIWARRPAAGPDGRCWGGCRGLVGCNFSIRVFGCRWSGCRRWCSGGCCGLLEGMRDAGRDSGGRLPVPWRGSGRWVRGARKARWSPRGWSWADAGRSGRVPVLVKETAEDVDAFDPPEVGVSLGCGFGGRDRDVEVVAAVWAGCVVVLDVGGQDRVQAGSRPQAVPFTRPYSQRRPLPAGRLSEGAEPTHTGTRPHDRLVSRSAAASCSSR